ncbi:ribonuclease J [bacterium AH-315-J23]|nr:ribonuclease J [bacterium AH-315-J23]
MAKKPDELVFLPLGGCGEIGMNLNLYGFGPPHKRKWIIVDIGVTFGNAETPGIDIIMPDIEYLYQIRKDILGIILTHAHEDHMGALARLWTRIRVPVYATPFTMYLTEGRLSEAGLLGEVPLHKIPLRGRFELGPFNIELITLTHSIPEPNALVIRTPAGLILHTGDWKIDPDPQIGEGVDVEALRAVGDEGVLAMVCDSTNVFSPGVSGSEAGVRNELIKVIGEYEGRGVAVASFASNVARLESVMVAAQKNGRSICLIGRSMLRMVEAAKAVGLLKKINNIVSEDEAQSMPSEHVLYLCTGSQGEPRAALSRIASGSHRSVKFGKGDVVIFSSKIIPGNEKGIFALQNSLADQGIEIVTEKDRDIHVSGHPCQDELKDMYAWARPHIAIPVHGERRHLLAHERLAKSLQVKHTLAPHNGELILLSENGAKIIDIVPNGRLHEDCGEIVSADDHSLRERKKMAYAGHISTSLVINQKGSLIGGPDVRIAGFPEGEEYKLINKMLDNVADCAEDAFNTMRKNDRMDEDQVEAKVTARVRRWVRNKTGKRALIETIVIKV